MSSCVVLAVLILKMHSTSYCNRSSYCYYIKCKARSNSKNNALPKYVGSHLGCGFVANIVAPLAYGVLLLVWLLCQQRQCQQQHCSLLLLPLHRLHYPQLNVPVSATPGSVLPNVRRCKVQQVGGKTAVKVLLFFSFCILVVSCQALFIIIVMISKSVFVKYIHLSIIKIFKLKVEDKYSVLP